MWWQGGDCGADPSETLGRMDKEGVCKEPSRFHQGAGRQKACRRGGEKQESIKGKTG